MDTDYLTNTERQAEVLAQVGPGTPGGELLRRYWQPIELSKNYPAGTPPRAVRVLGEDLVLFRDDHGRLGLLRLKCPHRCADLSYGRVENGGLRCVYHGWLFDVAGRCLNQPAEPGGGVTRDRIRHTAYPLVERAGAIFAYMGPGEPPLFPNYPALTVPDEYRFVNRWYSACNYLQGCEGNIDPVHTSYLHRYDAAKFEPGRRSSQDTYGVDTQPRISVADARFGLRIFTERRLPNGKMILRVTNFVMPNNSAIGGREVPLGRGGGTMLWHVPIDDTQHWRFEFVFHSKKMLPKPELENEVQADKAHGDHPIRNSANRYLQDREEMQFSYTGMGTKFATHDLFVTESQGAIHDRRNEHLVTSDVAIVRTRRLLLAAMEDVQAGKDPPGVVRDPARNNFDDLMALTETLDQGIDKNAFLNQLAEENIHKLDAPAPTETCR